MTQEKGSVFIAAATGIDLWDHAVLFPRLLAAGLTPLIQSTLLEEVEEQKHSADYLLYVINTRGGKEAVASLLEAHTSLLQDLNRTIILFLSSKPTNERRFDELVRRPNTAVPQAHIFSNLNAMLSWLTEESSAKNPASPKGET